MCVCVCVCDDSPYMHVPEPSHHLRFSRPGFEMRFTRLLLNKARSSAPSYEQLMAERNAASSLQVGIEFTKLFAIGRVLSPIFDPDLLPQKMLKKRIPKRPFETSLTHSL